MRFTKESVKKLKPNADGTRRDYLDDLVPGLGVRVSSERRLYFVTYRAPGQLKRVRRRKVLGDVRVMELDGKDGKPGARQKARALLGRVAEQHDPALEERQKRLRSTTVRELSERWVQAHAATWRPATLKGWQRFLDKEILPAIGEASPASVTREDILAILDRIKHGARGRAGAWKRKPAPVSAARCFEAARRMFKWAVSRGVIGVSPCAGIETPAKATKGSKTYSNDELRALFAALPGTQVEHLVPLIAFCGTRSGETRSARWTDVDIERKTWRIPAESSKSGARTGDPHDVPLSAQALAVLDAVREANIKAKVSTSVYLFPATADRKGGKVRDKDERRAHRLASHMGQPNRTLSKLATTTGVEDLALHNLRRTVATRLNEHGTPVHVIEHILGHRLPTLITTYQVHVPVAEMRAALDWWGAELEQILAAERTAQGTTTR